MKKLLYLLFVTVSLSIPSHAQDISSGEIVFFFEEMGVSYKVGLLWRAVGSNQNPQFQFRINRENTELRSIKTATRFYTFREINNLVFVETGNFLPTEIDAQAKFVLGSNSVFHAPGCRTSNDYRSDEFWATNERWRTIQIEDSHLINCLRNKDEGSWLEFGRVHQSILGIEVLKVELVGYNMSAIKSLIARHEAQQGGNEKGRQVLDTYCNRSYSNIDDIIQAQRAVREALSENITTAWIKESLENCLRRLDERKEDLSRPKEDYSASGQFNKYYELAVQAEQNGDYISAIRYYEEALKYQEHYGIRQRLPTLRQQANTQAVATGTAAVVTGMMDIREDMYTDKLDGVYISAITYSSMSYNRTPGIYISDDVSTGSIYATIDYTTWLDRTRNFGLHYGIDGRFDFDQKQDDDGIRYATSSSNLAAYLGFKTLGGYLEVDYYLRGLYLEGEAYGIFEGQNDESTVGLGGPIHWDGGLRAALYLWNDNTFFVRGVFHWVDNTENSPIGFLDFVNETNIRTQSMGYRIEMGVAPFAFYFFHEVNTYYPYNNSLPLGMDIWGIGACFGAGF